MSDTLRPVYIWNASQPAGDLLGVVRHRWGRQSGRVWVGGRPWVLAVSSAGGWACPARPAPLLRRPSPQRVQVSAALASASLVLRPDNATDADSLLAHAEELYERGAAAPGARRAARWCGVLGARAGLLLHCCLPTTTHHTHTPTPHPHPLLHPHSHPHL